MTVAGSLPLIDDEPLAADDALPFGPEEGRTVISQAHDPSSLGSLPKVLLIDGDEHRVRLC